MSDEKPYEVGEPRSEDEILAVDYITIDEIRSLYPHTKPLPPEHELDDAECHNCGEPWDEDEWDAWYSGKGIEMGEEIWAYQCPNCGFQTFECGT